MVQVGLDHTLFIQIFQFLIVVVIVNFFIAKPLYAVIQSRSSKIAALKQRAKNSLDAIANKKMEYEEQLKAVKAEIAEYNNQLKSNAEKRTQEMLDKIKAETSDELTKARTGIQREIDVARQSLEANVNNISKQIVDAVIK